MWDNIWYLNFINKNRLKDVWNMDKVLCLIGLIIIAIGMVCIYDARKITKKFFSSSDRNFNLDYILN